MRTFFRFPRGGSWQQPSTGPTKYIQQKCKQPVLSLFKQGKLFLRVGSLFLQTNDNLAFLSVGD